LHWDNEITAGLKEQQEVDPISVYSNPADYVLKFNLEHTKNYQIDLFNSIGKLEYSKKNVDTSNLKISVESFDRGIDYERFNSADTSQTKKIILY
jgi:hypothetical protein